MTDFCQITIDAFEGLIEKPPLTKELLLRPPFRFLHDIVTELVENTGFPDKVLEKNVANIKDREAKIDYLETVIDTVRTATGIVLDVKPGKIVAGKEAEKTNNFLQALANATRTFLLNKPDRKLVVENQQIQGSSGSAGSNKENKASIENKAILAKDEGKKSHRSKDRAEGEEKKKKKRKEKDEEKGKEKDMEGRKERPEHRRRRDKEEADSNRKEHRSTEKEETTEKEHKSRDKKNKEKEKNRKERSDSKSRKEKSKEKGGSKVAKKMQQLNDPGVKINSENKQNEHESIDQPSVNEVLPIVPLSRPMTSLGRPGTAMARLAPPKVKRKELGEVEMKPKLERNEETSNLIVNTTMEEEDFLVKEEPANIEILMKETNYEQTMDDNLKMEDHGMLVRKILKTKKELESELENEGQIIKKTTVIFDENELEKTKKETAKMQEEIQKMTRTVHPLGKLFDYVQEDIDSMLKELEQWKKEYHLNTSKLAETLGNTENDVEPLRMRLTDINNQIAETRDAISTSRASLIANDEKLWNMISSIGR